jgi:methylmalonyl-CoA mutase N-terminal domain/subunit
VPPTIEAVRAYATVGEVSQTLAGVFGSYQPDSVV